MDEDVLLEDEESRFSGDQRAEVLLGALVCGVVGDAARDGRVRPARGVAVVRS